MTPFSYESRQEIGRREKWQCSCGRSFRDGWMVQASHYDHDKSSDHYDDPDNGTISCITCHLRNHIELMLEDNCAWSYNSVRLLVLGAWNNGLHTRRYYESDPDQLERDRYEIIDILDSYGLDKDQFLG